MVVPGLKSVPEAGVQPTVGVVSTTSDYQLGPFRAGQRPSLVPEAWR